MSNYRIAMKTSSGKTKMVPTNKPMERITLNLGEGTRIPIYIKKNSPDEEELYREAGSRVGKCYNSYLAKYDLSTLEYWKVTATHFALKEAFRAREIAVRKGRLQHSWEQLKKLINKDKEQ